jgi:hypothetical protein
MGGWQKAKQIAFLRELPKEEQQNALELSKLTGISLKKICGDAMAEGLAVLRTDVYAELVRFNERRGKVIHEKDLEEHKPEPNNIIPNEQPQSANEYPAENGNAPTVDHPVGEQSPFLQTGEARPGDAHERSRLEPEIVPYHASAEGELGE